MFDQAQLRLRSGDAAAAASICEEALQEFPGDANILCIAARASLALRRFDQSARCAKEAIRLHPEFPNAHDVYGDLLLATGRADLAVDEYEKTLRLDPARPTTLKKIDRARELLDGAPDRAGEDSHHGLRRPLAYGVELGQAALLMEEGKADKAEDIYRSILKKDPDHVEATRLLAAIAALHKHFEEAEIFLRRAVEKAPDYARAWVDLVEVQRQLEKYDDGVTSARRVLELTPGKAEAYMVYAGAVGAAGRHEEAISAYGKALEISPNRAGAMCNMAHHLKTIGRSDEAIAQYRACIASKPDHAEAYWSLANLKTFSFENEEVGAMQALLEDAALPDESRVQLHNALGFAFEARGEYGQAFANFERCNQLRRKNETYDPVDTESTHDRVIEMFKPELLAQPAGQEREVTPIFIVGLPRSGSTLIEQILASHSRVDGTHELADLQKAVRATRHRLQPSERFPEALEKATSVDWQRIGEDYLSRTEKHRRGAPYFVDKNPNNFVFVGVLKLAIPNAKIINARRHPLDSCLGAYKQLFASGQPFTYDLTELGEYYLEYQRLMDHWNNVLPGFVLDVDYEDVVADLDKQVRRLLDFCGLPFEEACLRFHETERAVKTASSEQVRKPIYSSSVHRWRNYEDQLDELVHILEPLLCKLPPADLPGKLLQAQRFGG